MITGGAVVILLLFCLADRIFPFPAIISYSPVLYARDGQVLHVKLSVDEKWRIQTDVQEVTPLFIELILLKEDRFFRYHPGFNPAAIVRALWNNLIYGRRTSGASTISMQVARMLNRRPRTLTAKAIEIFRAMQLEWHYSKDEILAFYLRLLPYGGNVEGVKSASLLWLNKNPDQLSLAESVMLSVIPNRPNALHPLKFPRELRSERNKWLRRFYEEKKITEKQYTEALSEDIPEKMHYMPREAPHFANRMLTSGEEVYSSLNREIQKKCEQITQEYVKKLQSRQIQNAAVLVIHNPTMQVLGYIGSGDFFLESDGGQVDGIRAVRQPGSTLKPFIYARSIDKGIITPKTAMYDVPVQYGGFAPENFDQRFHGKISAEWALSNSLNVPAVKLLHTLSVDEMTSFFSKAELRQIAKNRRKLGLSLALGGCGVSLEELTTLYAMLANRGIFHPVCLTTGDTLARKDSLLSPSACFMITEMLSSIARPDLPVNWEQSASLPRIAWKTGTSYGRRDAWSIGYNKEYTIGVWCGNFSGLGAPDLSGADIATPLLFALFQTIDYRSNNSRQEMPAECNVRYVCSETGLPPGPECTQQVMDYYIPLVSSGETCSHLTEVHTDPGKQISFCPYCKPETGHRQVWYPNLPAEYRNWMEEERIPFEPIPPHNPECNRLSAIKQMLIISPLDQTEYLLNELEPEPIALKCIAPDGVKWVYWAVNNKPLKKCEPGKTLFYMPEEGQLKISCSDDQGRNTDIHISVKKVKW